MSAKSKSLVQTYMMRMIVVSCFSILIAGYFWISQEFVNFNKENERIRNAYIESQKNMIKTEVDKVVDYTNYMRSLREERLKTSITDRVYEAHSIATYIYDEYSGLKSNEEIAKMIKDALRPIRFSNDNGYYFATDLNGIEMLFADRPEYEGTNMLDFRDSHGKYIIREMIDIVKKNGEGFCEYSWTMPHKTGNDFSKIAYVKLFEPLGWLIGTGEYIDDVEEEIQQEILNRIAKIRFGNDGYIFVVSYNGITLMNDVQKELIGVNSWELTDPNGVKVIQEERRAVRKPEGDFINYIWEKPTTGIKTPKISFVRGIPEWQWMIGAGVYVDAIEHVIALRKHELASRILFNVMIIGTIIIALLVLFFSIARRFSNNIRDSFDVFSVFFENAAAEATAIDPEKLYFSEFKSLAHSANKMTENRNRIEKALKESESRYKRLFDQSYDAVFIHDFEGTIHDANVSAINMFGYEKEHLVSMTMNKLYAASKREMFENALGFVRNKGANRFYSTLVANNGDEIQAEISIRLIDADKGLLQQIVRDVTQQKLLEEQLRIHERMDSLGTLAGGIAHDFNNLLAGLIGNLEILRLKKDKLPEDITINIDEAYQSCIRSSILIKDIQSLSTGAVTEFTSVDIYSVAKDVFAILERTTDKLVEKKITFGEKRFYIHGKSDQLHQVFLNLGTNAFHAIAEKGIVPGDSITLSADEYTVGPNDALDLPHGDYIVITFSDTGTGMTEEVKKRAFDPLFSTKMRSSHKGQGLGLAMVYNIITRNHNGRIIIDSKIGAGTSFHIYLPKAEPVEIPAAPAQTHRVIKGNETILVVEDEDLVRSVAERLLRMYGYSTISAGDGKSGLEMYKEKQDSIDLVLLDLTMPVMSGHMMLEKLIEINPKVKVVISSGQSELEMKKLSLARGYVTKPFSAADMAKTIRTVLDSE